MKLGNIKHLMFNLFKFYRIKIKIRAYLQKINIQIEQNIKFWFVIILFLKYKI